MASSPRTTVKELLFIVSAIALVPSTNGAKMTPWKESLRPSESDGGGKRGLGEEEEEEELDLC